MFAATDKEYANIMNARSGGRIKVDKDEWGYKVLVPRDDGSNEHDIYYVNHPGFSMNDFKRAGADMLVYLSPARLAGIPKGLSGRMLAATGSGFGVEVGRDVASKAAGGEWDPLHVFGGVIGIGFGQLASEGIGKLLQAGASAVARPKRFTADETKGVDVRAKGVAKGSFRVGNVYKTLDPKIQNKTGRLYEFTPRVKTRLTAAGIDPSDFNDEAILALNRIVKNNSDAVDRISARTVLSDIPMTNVQKAVQDDMIHYSKYSQLNPVESLQIQQLGRKGALGNEIVEELHTLESDQVAAVGDLIDALAGTKLYQQYFRQQDRKGVLAGATPSSEARVGLDALENVDDIIRQTGAVSDKDLLKSAIAGGELAPVYPGRFGEVIEDLANDPDKVFEPWVDDMYNLANRIDLVKDSLLKRSAGSRIKSAIGGYAHQVDSSGRLSRGIESGATSFRTLFGGGWKSDKSGRDFKLQPREWFVPKKKLRKADIEQLETAFSDITKEYVKNYPKGNSAAQAHAHTKNNLVEAAHTEAFGIIAKHLSRAGVSYKDKQHLMKLLKKERTLYFKSANQYTQEMKDDVDRLFTTVQQGQRERLAEDPLFLRMGKPEQRETLADATMANMPGDTGSYRKILNEADELVDWLFDAGDFIGKKQIGEINKRIKDHVANQSYSAAEAAAGGPIGSTGNNALFAFRRALLRKIVLPKSIRRVEEGSFPAARRSLYDMGKHLNKMLAQHKDTIRAGFAPAKGEVDISGEVVKRLERLANDLHDVNKVNYGEWRQPGLPTNFRKKVKAAFDRFTVPTTRQSSVAGSTGPAVITKKNTQWQAFVGEVMKLVQTTGLGSMVMTTAMLSPYPGYAITGAALTGLGGYALTHSSAMPGRFVKQLLAKSSGQASTPSVLYQNPTGWQRWKYGGRRGMAPTASRAATYALLPDAALWTAGRAALGLGYDISDTLQGPYKYTPLGAALLLKGGAAVPGLAITGAKYGAKEGAKAAGRGVKAGARKGAEKVRELVK